MFIYCGNPVAKNKKTGKQITPSFALNFLDFPSFFPSFFCKYFSWFSPSFFKDAVGKPTYSSGI